MIFIINDLHFKIKVGSKQMATNGQYMTVIDIDDNNFLTIQFEDGTIRSNISKIAFKIGRVRNSNINKDLIGTEKVANNGQKMKVIGINHKGFLIVEFEDGTIKEGVTKNTFISGSVRNPNFKNSKFKIGHKKISAKGQLMTIIDVDKNTGLFTVEFEDGAIKQGVSYSSFSSGTVKNPNDIKTQIKSFSRKIQIGDKNFAKNGQEMTVIDIDANNLLTVQFEDGEIRTDIQKGNFMMGNVRNYKYHSVSASFPELAIFYYVKKIFPDTQNGNRKILKGKEIDIYIPSLSKGIEYDGEAFHNKEKDDEKNILAKKAGIELIRIREPNCPDITPLSNVTIIKRNSVSDDNDLEATIKKVLNTLIVKYENDFVDLSRDYADIMRLKKDKTGQYLAVANPELAREWHPTKNGELTPNDVLITSCKKVWWLLPYDVPEDYHIEHLRGRHFDFEWEASTNDRMRGKGCPYLTGYAVWPGFNDLSTTCPELAKQWHPTKNINLRDNKGRDISSPDKVSKGNRHKVWWHIPYDVPEDHPVEHLRGKHFDFEWEATISNRVQSKDCPFLSGKAVWVGFNDLASVFPEIANQWHPYKNIGLIDKYGNDISTPDKVTANSGQKVWWYFPYTVPDDYPVVHLRGEHFDFEWEASPHSRINSQGCPFLSNHTIWPGFNDLATTHPELAQQWHPTKNGDLTPEMVSKGMHNKIWWKCPVCGYEVEMRIAYRAQYWGSLCPHCREVTEK